MYLSDHRQLLVMAMFLAFAVSLGVQLSIQADDYVSLPMLVTTVFLDMVVSIEKHHQHR